MVLQEISPDLRHLQKFFTFLIRVLAHSKFSLSIHPSTENLTETGPTHLHNFKIYICIKHLLVRYKIQSAVNTVLSFHVVISCTCSSKTQSSRLGPQPRPPSPFATCNTNNLQR